jgi:NAD-dependent deacetylase
VASGLPTFDFAWRGVPARELLTLSSFLADPARFYLFFREALETWGEAQPNAAHRAIARAGLPVITQNIDGLHQEAGSRIVCELHGNLRGMTCPRCGWRGPMVLPDEGPPACSCGAVPKPDAVLCEESLQDWEKAVALLNDAVHLLVVGTSLQVAPACHLPEFAAARGARVEIINLAAETRVPEAIARLEREGVIPPADLIVRA